MNHQTVIVLDFGGQYNQLIARRVRDLNVYCEVLPFDTPIDTIRSKHPVGIIFTGGPSSVNTENAPKADVGIFSMGVPVLGICYGAQFTAAALGGSVKKCDTAEFGKTVTAFVTDSLLFQNLPDKSVTWMSHNDAIETLPEGFTVTAVTDACPVAAMENSARRIYAVQFHPEVLHTQYGKELLHNFLYKICGVAGDWTMSGYAQTAVEQLRREIGSNRILLGLSGGVDSSVAAALLSKAVGNQLVCIFVDTGLMRKNEGDEVETAFANMDLQFVRANAADYFLSHLKGVTDPEQKRKIIGEGFIRIFEQEARKLGAIDFFAQGTIYPDVIESGSKNAAVIKSHHNVGGLPERMEFKKIIEPLRLLFKDETRALGTELGLPDYLVHRQPFPGPGLAVRVIGEITEPKLSILREADAIFREEIAAAGLDKEINQYFAVLTDMRSVGVMGDSRTYDYTLALRGVTTADFMTADWARIPFEVLDIVSRRIVNEVKGINRIVYDITGKPPATVEWE